MCIRDSSYAKELSEHIGVQNYRKIITPEEYWNILPTVQYHMDEPHADPSAVALYFVSQIASEKVKVVLSGEGSDELFGGYNIYQMCIRDRAIGYTLFCRLSRISSSNSHYAERIDMIPLMLVRLPNISFPEKPAEGAPHYFRLHMDGTNSISMGKISSRPASITKAVSYTHLYNHL